MECIYGPNEDSPNFFSEKAFKKIEDWDPNFTISAGDFNVALEPKVDTRNYLHVNNPQARSEIKAQMENCI